MKKAQQVTRAINNCRDSREFKDYSPKLVNDNLTNYYSAIGNVSYANPLAASYY